MFVNPGNWERVAQCNRVFGDDDRFDVGRIPKFEMTGTLSHMLTVELARYEEEMTQAGKILPKWEPPKRPRFRETNRLQPGAEKSNREEQRR